MDRWKMLRTMVHNESDRERVIHLDGFQTPTEELLAQLFDLESDLMAITLRWRGTKSKRKPDDRYRRGA